ncbi:hypothetical protein EVAR_25904_1 [Eumeta japonica]|uniref:Uncharacterized protein n=1 Tax=Eumeta variegata TaxID=151549 RepID=A0A4C1W3X8_EUMVA|nr:hypothetical protein EVAR_25904_1 [Eumeta japonica]
MDKIVSLNKNYIKSRSNTETLPELTSARVSGPVGAPAGRRHVRRSCEFRAWRFRISRRRAPRGADGGAARDDVVTFKVGLFRLFMCVGARAAGTCSRPYSGTSCSFYRDTE